MNCRRLIILLLGLMMTAGMSALNLSKTKAEADSAFTHENYPKAISLYKQLAKQTDSPQIYYNLGCAYYRTDSIAKSVLWLERASLLDPGDDDINVNLDLARSKTIDRIIPQHEFIIVTFFRQAVNMMNLNSWAITCIVLFFLTLLTFGLFFFSNKMVLRKILFFSAIVLLLLTIFGNVCAYQQRALNNNHNHGIVMSPAITVKSTPAQNGNDLFVIHEGTNVEILDSSLKDWYEIKIADGKVGWIPKNSFEII